MSAPTPSDIPAAASIAEPSDTMYAIVMRHPRGGYAVVAHLVEFDTAPELDPENDPVYMTLAAAVRFAQSAGLYCLHPNVYRSPNRLEKGI